MGIRFQPSVRYLSNRSSIRIKLFSKSPREVETEATPLATTVPGPSHLHGPPQPEGFIVEETHESGLNTLRSIVSVPYLVTLHRCLLVLPRLQLEMQWGYGRTHSLSKARVARHILRT